MGLEMVTWAFAPRPPLGASSPPARQPGAVFFIIGFAFRPACLVAFWCLTVIAIAQYDAHPLRTGPTP